MKQQKGVARPSFSMVTLAVVAVVAALLTGVIDGAGLRDDPIAGDAVMYLDGTWTASSSLMTIPAKVPGDLISDLFNAGKIKDPIVNNNWLDSTLWNNYTWVYTSPKFTVPSHLASNQVLLVFDGVKMGAEVFLNGIHLGVIRDQFLRYTFKTEGLINKKGTNTVSVYFNQNGPDVQGRFMACTGGWDWAPYSNTFDTHGAHTLSKGIWKSVYITTVSSVAIPYVVPSITYSGPYPRTPLTDDNHAPFNVKLMVHLFANYTTKGRVQVTSDWGATYTSGIITISPGTLVYNVSLSTAGRRVKLWWPNGLGQQNLYNVSVTFTASSGVSVVTTSRRVGFRVFALVTTQDEEEGNLKDGSGTFTMRFRINGANVFARGANMIPMEEYEGRANVDAFRYLVRSAQEAHMNILRIWGGGIFYYDVFYDMCDELGLILYHDMMYAQEGHSPLNTLTQSEEIRHQVRRLSHHPSIVIWDGCNECGGLGIYANFVMSVVAQEDTSRAVWPSCPSPGWQSGVDTLYSTPNGNTLVPRKDKGVQEQHGPYQHGSGWPAVNGDKKLELFDPRLPPQLNGPSLLGVKSPGYFVSEFGSVGWSSFESMSPTLSPQYWSLHSTPMYQRNYPCDNIIDVYWGKQNLNVTGANAFKKQLYQCLIGQTLELKSEIEYLRSTNTFGTVIWQLNEIWPTGGWGSIEYGTPVAGQVIGGRWKPLHYLLKSTLFPDVTATCGNASFCMIRNDAPQSFMGTVDLSMVHFGSGTVSAISSLKVSVGGSSSAQWFCIKDAQEEDEEGDKEDEEEGRKVEDGASLNCAPWSTVFRSYGCANGGADCILSITVTSQNGAVISENVVALDIPANMNLPSPSISFMVQRNSEGGADIILSTNQVALYVTLTTAAPGRFSENAILLLPGKKTLKFIPIGSLDINLLSSTLRVEHAQQYQ